MSENIITTLIEICVPTLASFIAGIWANSQAKSRTKEQAKENAKNFAKNNIITLILDDQRRMDKDMPIMNYQFIMREYDDYAKNGGNSYVHDRVEEYKKEVAEKYGNIK